VSDPFERTDSRVWPRPEVPVGGSWSNDGPDNPCFGCRQHGDPGLRMTFTRIEERLVECRWTPDPMFTGWATVVHGGIQATLLDEIMGATTGVQYTDPDLAIVTLGLDVRFRRPAPMGEELTIRGRLDEIDGTDHHLSAEIVAADGTVCTTATSTWRRLR